MRGAAAEAARCPEEHCGRPAIGEGSRPPVPGEVVVHVAGSDDPARVYCGGRCASLGIAHVELGNHRPRPVPDPLHGQQVGDRSEMTTRAGKMRAAGVGPVDFRQWGLANGLAVADRGVPSNRVIDAYVEAHQAVAR